MTSIPQNKQELYQSISSSFDDILRDYADIPDSYSRTTGVEGNVKGTKISVCDTLAYLIGWGKLVLQWHQLSSQKQPVIFPDKGYKWNELGRLAQRFHQEYQEWKYPLLLDEFKRTVTDVLALVDSLSNAELYQETWYKDYTLGRMIQLNTSSPMKNMRTKVRRFKKNSGLG